MDELPQQWQALIRLGINSEREVRQILLKRHGKPVIVPSLLESIFYPIELENNKWMNKAKRLAYLDLSESTISENEPVRCTNPNKSAARYRAAPGES